MSAYPFHSGPPRGRALSAIAAITLVALATGLSSAAFDATPTPIEATGERVTITFPKASNLDPWESIQGSLQQFGHPQFILRLFLSLALAVGCASLIAWYPHRSPLLDPLFKLEERKALILFGLVGASVAELSRSDPTLGLIIFGIGALLRFRTVFENPKLTGKAIIVVVVGLACGMGSWAMALLVTAFSWLLIYWLDSRWSCRIRIDLEEDVDSQPIFDMVESLLASKHCRLKNFALYEDKRRLVFLVYVPSRIDPRKLEAELRTKVKRSDAKIDIDVHSPRNAGSVNK